MKHISPNQLWTQVPVANRLVEVNTKTGYSLTAGSYSVRASSVQRGLAAGAGGAVNVAVSAVTLANAPELHNGMASSLNNLQEGSTRMELSTTTNVLVSKLGGTGTAQTHFVVPEYF